MKNIAFTLIELLVVLAIVGVLSVVAFTHYRGTVEQTLDREAEANLRLIMAAERIYQMEDDNRQYYVSTGATTQQHVQNINNNLRLSLPNAANRNWNYRTFANNIVNPRTCCVQADRNATPVRKWRIRNTEDNPVMGGTCP